MALPPLPFRRLTSAVDLRTVRRPWLRQARRRWVTTARPTTEDCKRTFHATTIAKHRVSSVTGNVSQL